MMRLILNDSISFKEYLPFEHHSCFAHTLNLVVKDGLAKAGQLGSVIKKCSKLVSFVRKSTIATDVLKGQKRLQTDNETRWNSQLKMIRSVLAVQESKLSELDGAVKLTMHDRNILHDLVEILQPFEEATDSAQVSCVPSAGYVLPCVRGLNHHMQHVTSKYSCSLISALKVSLDRRMAYYEENNVYVLAAILDPRFKLRWCLESEKDYYTEILVDATKQIAPMSAEGETSLPNPQPTGPPPCKKTKSLFSFMPETSSSQQANLTSDHQVDDYLRANTEPMDTNPANFWKEHMKKYPVLAKLAKECLAVPASSAPVERLFSIAGKVFTPERCRLTDSRFEQLMFIRCNIKE